jgi:hypothetical protein
MARTRSDSIDAMEMLDELMNFEDDDGLGSPQRSQDSGGSHSPNYNWRLTNPVHMELQENAKVSTYPLSIDRSGSSTASHLLHNDTGLNLGEAFLGGQTRQSYHANYAQAGVLKHYETEQYHSASNNVELLSSPANLNVATAVLARPNRSNSVDLMEYMTMITDGEKKDSAIDPLDELAAEVDPTPLEEIKNRHAARHFGNRQEPLPIPTSAVMTAAAIAKHQFVDAGTTKTTGSQYTQHQSNANTATNTITAAMERASQQKSQYGFGRKHKVPSVPEPLNLGSNRNSAPSPTSTEDGGGNTLNSGVAYERKKQRAKVARVKLNESIEQLSIAIHVAGTQSMERAAQWQAIVPSSIPPSMKEAASTAESAKKWDRPSFVASAAKMCEYLNTQCDILMRELITIKNGKSAEIGKRKQDGGGDNDDDDDDGLDDNDDEHAIEMKRRRILIDPKQCQTIHGSDEHGLSLVISSATGINGCICSFIDPVSLVRCTQVSKTWKQLFSSSPAWNDMAVQRFGYFNVRQWQEKLEDTDEGITCVPLRLYKSMDVENVMPHFNHDGMFLLGEARLQGVVSAWTFLVERSNGETLRSCRRPGDLQNSFTSLPIVELRTVVQNTGVHDDFVVIRDQIQSVDASTRRRGVEMREVDWDDRFQKKVLHLDGSASLSPVTLTEIEVGGTLCRLKLYDFAVIQSFIHAKGCSTISKFVQRSNFTKIIVQLRYRTTFPLVIPFPRDNSHHLEH